MIATLGRPSRYRDTPCALCGHAHAGSDRFYNGNNRVYVERCGEWLSQWSLAGASFWMCECEEWRQPAHRCNCGATSRRPFPAWLGGVRACSRACAERALSWLGEDGT